MELLQILQNRGSVRTYTGEPIPEEKLNLVLQAGLLSPSGRNRRPWELIVVREKETLAKLAKCRDHGAGMLTGADAAIVVFADPEKTDVWTEDASITMTSMHIMADSLGLGSCWIQGRLRTAEDGRPTEEYVRELLGVPEHYKLEAILSLGMPESHPEPKKLEDLMTEKIHREKF